MRTRPLHFALLVFALPAAFAIPIVSAAGEGGDPPKAGSAARGDAAAPAPTVRRDEANQTGISAWMETILQGNAKYLSRDFPGAIESFRKAIQLAPKQPLGHYLLGETQIAAGNLPEADASFAAALRVADERDPATRAKVLFATADLKERQKKWDDAKVAWQAYAEFLAKVAAADGGTIGFPKTAAARIEVIDAALKLEREMEKVRQRARDTADGGVFTLVDASPG